jgi:hypothetical protein
MAEDDPDMSLVSEAVVVWIRGGERPYPSTDDARVIERYGEKTACRLLPTLRQLERDCFASDAYKRGADLYETARLAERDVRAEHPELTTVAVDALVNLYAWRWK